MNNDHLNSKEYWDHRFEADWEAMHGREQSHFFAKLALEHLPSWFFTLARTQEFTFCDWGCAEGDGTEVLCSAILGLTVFAALIFPRRPSKKHVIYIMIFNFWLKTG